MRQLLFGILFFHLAACSSSDNQQELDGEIALLFSIQQEREIYEKSDYGEPPQFAIWLENKESGEIQTVFVTYRTATGDWEGKAECPVSLPAWIGAWRNETDRNDFPTVKNPAADAVTGATPQEKEFSVTVSIAENSNWFYYIEMNVSTDYNPAFPRFSDGWFDFQGNGQPSIIYRGEITGTPGERSTPKLIGRTEQGYFSPEINHDLKGIDSAKDVFSKINVICIIN